MPKTFSLKTLIMYQNHKDSNVKWNCCFLPMCSKKDLHFYQNFQDVSCILWLYLCTWHASQFFIFAFCCYPLFFGSCVYVLFLSICTYFFSLWSILSLTIHHTQLPQAEQHLVLFCPLSKMTKTFPIMDISASKTQ